MCLTHPDILRLEKFGVPEDRHCVCGNTIYGESLFCEPCQDEFENMKDDERRERE